MISSLAEALARRLGKGIPREHVANLSAVEYLLLLWQSDCSELKAAGVEMLLDQVQLGDGRAGILLVLVNIQLCPKCKRFRSTREAHLCNE